MPWAQATSVFVLAPEPLGASLTGPARRAVKLAETVAEHCAVTLGAPSPSTFPNGPFRALETGPVDDQDLDAALAGHDIAVVQSLPSPRQLVTARRRVPRLVVDLIAPFALEALEIGQASRGRAATVRWRAREMVAHLRAADLVLCTNERQRDLLVGAALAAGLLDGDPSRPPMAARITVVPHGLDPAPRARGRSSLRTGELAGNLRIAVWGGGIWRWLDPLTAIRGVERLRPRRPDVRLAFVGFHHPDPAQRAAHARGADEARAYVRDRRLEDTVIFRPRWLSRDEYLNHLADADVGVSLHGPTLEGRYASRTRILDYVEARLPVVAAKGDTMSEVVARHGLGRVVAPCDADACAAALDELTRPGAARLDDATALEPLLWPNVARPLVEFCVDPPPPRPASRREALAVVAREYPAFVRALGAQTGSRGIARAALRGAARLRRQPRDA